MKCRIKFIVLAVIVIFALSSEALAVWLPSDIRPADAYSNPDDYALIFMDRDGWELRMNPVSETSYVTRYRGVLYYGYGSSRYLGDLEAVYYKSDKMLLITCIDAGWNDYTLSYAMRFDDTRPSYYWRMWGTYLYFDDGSSNTIYADIVKGELDGHVPYHS